MPRYLTPAKIGLLALIEMYTENRVPTTSTIPVLSFITSKILPSSQPRPRNPSPPSDDEEPAAAHDPDFVIGARDFEALLAGHASVSGLPGRTLWDIFVRKLWEIGSLHALHAFVEHKSRLLARTKAERRREEEELGAAAQHAEDVIVISRVSPFGMFIRRAHLEFARLKFQDTTALWKSFLAWRQCTTAAWMRRNPALRAGGRWAVVDSVLLEEPGWTEGELATVVYGDMLVESDEEDVNGLVSTDDVEKLLEFQVEQMQKLGSRVSDEIKRQFRTIMNGNMTVPSLSHYVNFLDAWRAGDYPTSFDNLHRFFDYTMQNRDRLFYQYALLNLAVLQADFGCYYEAVAAMQETVTTARENKDMGCLNFSLSWLYHFGKTHPDVLCRVSKDNASMLGVDRSGLAFLRSKAKESGMWSLLSSSLLSEAKMALSNGESVASAFENILRSSHLTITKNLLTSVGCQHLLQSSLWSRLGVAHLAFSYTELFLRGHSRFAPFDDVLKFTCRLAYLLAQQGHYDLAMAKMDSLDPNALKTLKANQYHLRFKGILKLKRDLHHGNLDGADQLLRQLLQGRGGDSDLRFELSVLHVDALMRRGAHTAALAQIEQLFRDMAATDEDVYYRVKLLSLKAELHDRCGRPHKGFSVAVRAASIAWRARLLPALWHAMGAIARILTALDECAAARHLLASIVPRALECDDAGLAAGLYARLVDAEMGLAGHCHGGGDRAPAPAAPRRARRAEHAEPERKVARTSAEPAPPPRARQTEHFTRALDFAERAVAAYARIEDVAAQGEMMAKKAVILRCLGEEALAMGCAAQYCDVRREAAMRVAA